MNFEWDERKRRENIRKHGIDFADLSQVFSGPMLVRLDERRAYGEDRWIGIGRLRSKVVVVVYVERREETIRFISARKANRYEQEKYEERD